MRGSRFDRQAGGRRTPHSCGFRPCESVRVRVGSCLFLSLVVFLAPAGVAAGSMAATSPVPRATVPPSTYGGGLINTPNPIDRSSSLPITGNVQGGKHFRGTIPYNSTTSFGAPLGSTSLDSFLRYSGVPDGLSGYPQGYSPFYSPTGTVTTTLPGYPGVFAPTSPRIAAGLPQTRIDQPSDTFSLTEIPQFPSGQYGTQADPSAGVSPRLQLWSMSRSPAEMKGVIADELGDSLTQQSLAQPGVPTVAPEEYQRQLEQLRRDIDRIKSDASHLVETRDLASPQNTDGRMMPPLPQSPQAPAPQQEPGPTTMQDLTSVPEGVSFAPSTQAGLRLYDPSVDSTGVRIPPPAEVGRTGTAPAPGVQSGAQTDQDITDKLSASRRVEEAMRGVDAKSRFLGHPPGGVPGAHSTKRRPFWAIRAGSWNAANAGCWSG